MIIKKCHSPHPTTSNTPWGWDPSTQPPPPDLRPLCQPGSKAPPYQSTPPLNLFHHPQSEDTSHFLLFIQNSRFKYNLRTPPSTGVCLCFPPLPPQPPTRPHGHSLGVLGGQGNVGGLWRDQGTVLETRHNDRSLFPLGPKRQ